MSGNADYWIETVECALKEAGLSATRKQIEAIAGDMEVSAEMQGHYLGHDAIPNPLADENEKLKRELKREREKYICLWCNGTRLYRGYTCWKCNGKGFKYYD